MNHLKIHLKAFFKPLIGVGVVLVVLWLWLSLLRYINRPQPAPIPLLPTADNSSQYMKQYFSTGNQGKE